MSMPSYGSTYQQARVSREGFAELGDGESGPREGLLRRHGEETTKGNWSRQVRKAAALLGTGAVLGVVFFSAMASSDSNGSARIHSLSVRLPKPLGLNAVLDDRIEEYSSQKVLFTGLSEEDQKGLFDQFKKDHQKVYTSPDDEAGRLETFKANLALIDSLNAANPLALYAITKYTDYTEDEKKKMRAQGEYADYETMKARLPEGLIEGAPKAQSSKGSKASKGRTATHELGEVGWATEDDCAACEQFPGFRFYNAENMPTDFDWRALGAVTEVKNQKYCGSCWTFSTTGDVEGTHFLATGDLTSLSEQQLVACDANVGYCEGCNGGYPYAAMDYVTQFGGLVSDDAYPYKGICAWDACGGGLAGTPTCDKEVLNTELESKAIAHIGGWQMVALGAEYEDSMALVMLKNGPLSVAFNAHGQEYYVHGVTGCPSTQYPEYCQAGSIDQGVTCDPTYLDHAVLLVGYGVQDGVDYWLIKNSWGTEWGDGGYYRQIRGENFCGVANMVVHSVVKDVR